MMRYKSIIEKFCRDNSGIVKMIKTIFLFGFLVVFVLFVLLLQNSNLNIEESIFKLYKYSEQTYFTDSSN